MMVSLITFSRFPICDRIIRGAQFHLSANTQLYKVGKSAWIRKTTPEDDLFVQEGKHPYESHRMNRRGSSIRLCNNSPIWSQSALADQYGDVIFERLIFAVPNTGMKIVRMFSDSFAGTCANSVHLPPTTPAVRQEPIHPPLSHFLRG